MCFDAQLKAYEASQKYKEGRFIIEKGKVVKVRLALPRIVSHRTATTSADERSESRS